MLTKTVTRLFGSSVLENVVTGYPIPDFDARCSIAPTVLSDADFPIVHSSLCPRRPAGDAAVSYSRFVESSRR